jgi:death on curing protein
MRPMGFERTMGRPSKFDTMVQMAMVAWAPVLHFLSQEDLANLDKMKYNPGRAQVSSWRDYNIQHPRRVQSDRIWWPNPVHIIRVHDDMITGFGGRLGNLNLGFVDAAIDRAKHSQVYGQDQHPTIMDKTAAMMHSILRYHPFVDGQKRTGIATAFIFLGMNGWTMWSRDYRSEVHFAIEIAKGEHEVDVISQWLQERVAPSRVLRAVRGEPLTNLLGKEEAWALCHYCSRNLRIKAFRTYCKNCDVWYSVELKVIAFTFDHEEHRVTRVKAGLHKIDALSERGFTPEILEALAKSEPGEIATLLQRSLFDE